MEPLLPDLRERAVSEASQLPPISAESLRTKLQSLPENAPGADGWNNRMLKQLPAEGLTLLLQFLHDMERTGQASGQWRVVKFALLAKNELRESPIGLCNAVNKAWLQVRYVSAWLQEYKRKAPWDACSPGRTCLSVAVHRVFQAELAIANSQHRVTLFLDLIMFYETISHVKLVQSARELQYPATLLNIAIQIYRGARVLTADSGYAPAAYSGQGVVAGCPIAPSLSKLALHRTCEQVATSSLVANLDTWIDDISADMVSTCPAKVAAKSVQVLRMMIPWCSALQSPRLFLLIRQLRKGCRRY